MKTTKKLVVLCLALFMCVVAIMPSTFSWYNHNGTHSGNSMAYSRTNLPVSTGTVSMVTKKFRMNGNKVYYDEKGNKEHKDAQGNAYPALSSDSVAKDKVQYYGTTFTNTSTIPVYVNLYLGTFSNDPKNYIGTTAPSLTHKGISPSVHIKNKSQVRVYFQWDKAATGWNANGARTYVISKNSAGTVTVTQFDTTNNKITGNASLENVTTYYADLPDNTTSFYFATDAGVSANVNQSTGAVSQLWYYTRTVTDVQAGKGYYLTGSADDTTFNAQFNTFDIPSGLSVKTYFDTATMSAGQKTYVTLDEGKNFTGESASYVLQSGSGISVNANTGQITADSSFTHGSSAVVRTTITTALGDSTTVDTAITNPPSLSSATVSTNILVPGKTTETVDGEEVVKNGTAEVVWYIDNKSNAACAFNSIYYTK